MIPDSPRLPEKPGSAVGFIIDAMRSVAIALPFAGVKDCVLALLALLPVPPNMPPDPLVAEHPPSAMIMPAITVAATSATDLLIAFEAAVAERIAVEWPIRISFRVVIRIHYVPVFTTIDMRSSPGRALGYANMNSC